MTGKSKCGSGQKAYTIPVLKSDVKTSNYVMQ